jgi:chromosome partitioning protein
VLNRVPARGRLLDVIRAKIADEKMPLANSTLGSRSAFASSMLEGKGVVETQPKSSAANEIRALAEEIATILDLAADRRG